MRKFRPKGKTWRPVPCFFAENRAFLEIQFLKLQSIDLPEIEPPVAPALAFAAEFEQMLGVSLGLTENDVRAIEAELSRRMSQKRYRDSEKGQATRLRWHKNSLLSQAEQTKAAKAAKAGDYVPGGGAEAAVMDDADLQKMRKAQEAEWCGEGGLVDAEVLAVEGEAGVEGNPRLSEQRALEMKHKRGDFGVACSNNTIFVKFLVTFGNRHGMPMKAP